MAKHIAGNYLSVWDLLWRGWTIGMGLILCMTSAGFSAAAADEGENVALGKPVTASGYYQEAETDESPAMVNDGNMDTKWCSRVENYNDPGHEYLDTGHWITIDLTEETLVDSFVIHMASEGGQDKGLYEYNLRAFTVEVSTDGETWIPFVTEEELYSTSTGGKDVEGYTRTFDPISIRYFRLSSKDPALMETIIRIPEIEILAAPAGAEATPIEEAAQNMPTRPAPTAASGEDADTPIYTSPFGGQSTTGAIEKPDAPSPVVIGSIIGGAVVIAAAAVTAVLLVKRRRKS